MKVFSLSLFLLFSSFFLVSAQFARKTLVEEFSSPTCPFCPPVMSRFKNVILPNSRNVGLFWCVWYPGLPSPLMGDYDETVHRHKKYSVPGSPTIVSCGSHVETGTSAGQFGVNCGTSTTSPYFMMIQNRFSMDTFCVQVKIGVNVKTANPNRRLYIAAIEKECSLSFSEPFISNGVTEYPRLFRKMLPDTNGIALPDTFYPGPHFVIEVKRPNSFGCFYNVNQAASVAFIQSTVQPYQVWQAEENLTSTLPTNVNFSQPVGNFQTIHYKQIRSMKGLSQHLTKIFYDASNGSAALNIQLSTVLPNSWKALLTDSNGVVLANQVITTTKRKSSVYVQVWNGGDTTANIGGKVNLLVNEPGKSPAVLSFYIYNRITTLYADFSGNSGFSSTETIRKSDFMSWMQTAYPGVSLSQKYLDTSIVENAMISPKWINSLVVFADSNHHSPWLDPFPLFSLLLIDRGVKAWIAGTGPIRYFKFPPQSYMPGISFLVRNRFGASYKSTLPTGNHSLLKFDSTGIDTAQLVPNQYDISSIQFTGPANQLEKIWAVSDTAQLVAFSRNILEGNRRLYTSFWPWQLKSDSSRRAITRFFMKGTSSFLTGVENFIPESEEKEIPNIWPNPGNIGFHLDAIGSVAIFDCRGKQVRFQQAMDRQHFVSMVGLPSGIYQVRFSGTNAKTFSIRYAHLVD